MGNEKGYRTGEAIIEIEGREVSKEAYLKRIEKQNPGARSQEGDQRSLEPGEKPGKTKNAKNATNATNASNATNPINASNLTTKEG